MNDLVITVKLIGNHYYAVMRVRNVCPETPVCPDRQGVNNELNIKITVMQTVKHIYFYKLFVYPFCKT